MALGNLFITKNTAPFEATAREKAMKKWYRLWKLNTIEAFNPEWQDLSELLNM